MILKEEVVAHGERPQEVVMDLVEEAQDPRILMK